MLTASAGGAATCILLVGGYLAGTPVRAQAPAGKAANGQGVATMDVADIRPGMKGYALTVFSGTQPDRFDIEVVDIVPDYQTGQDAILFRSPDPRLVHSGIVGGMSGSPIFIDGKLVGALAYGYRFNKDPLGGITPIANMLEVDKLPYRPELIPGPRAQARGRTGSLAWADAMLGLDTSPMPPRSRPEAATGAGLEPLGTPMTVAGFGPRAAQFLADTTGLLPARGGGSNGSNKTTASPPPAKQWGFGDSVSVVLIDGDLSAAPNGTVTWVGGSKGERLLAFGHPMQGVGPTKLPIADARVHVIIPSVERSVKIASPLHVRGTMIQDRQPAISLRTDIQAPLIPVHTSVTGPDPDLKPRSYESRVAEGNQVTPALVIGLLLQAIEEAAPDAVEIEVELDVEMAITTSKGPRTLKFRDEIFFPLGVSPGPLIRTRAGIAIQAILDNPFEIAEIRDVKQVATVRYSRGFERIEAIEMRSAEVRAGDLLELDLLLKPVTGPRRRQTIALRVPDDLDDEDIMVEVTSGSMTPPARKAATSVDDIIDAIAQGHTARSIVATIYDGREGVATESGYLPELPSSVTEGLAAEGSTLGAIRVKRLARRVIESKTLVEGAQSVRIHVLPKKYIDG